MLNETELVSDVLKGNLQAFGVLVKQYERLVFHVVSRMVPDADDRQDICQEVFIKVHRNLKQFKHQSKLSTWIARITYLTAINYLKKFRRHQTEQVTELDEKLFANADNPADLLVKKDVSAYLNSLIGKLPEHYRIVLTLYHLDEFSYQEIETVTGFPEGTVKSYLFRARKLLKEKLEIYLKKEVV